MYEQELARSLLSLSSDEFIDFVSLYLSSVVGSESAAGNLHGLLLLGSDAGTDEFHHLLLVGGESSDLTDDLTDELNSLAEATLSVNSLALLAGNLWLGDDEALVEAHEDSTLALHLSIFN